MGTSKSSEFAQMQGAEKISQRSSWDEIWIFKGAIILIAFKKYRGNYLMRNDE